VCEGMNMTEEEIVRKHKNAFDFLASSLKVLESAVANLSVNPGEGQQVMIAGLAERLRTSAQGCGVLGRNGLSAEVQVLARVCVEITFKLLGIHANADLVKTYAQEHLFFRKKSLKAITTDLKSSFSAAELVTAESDLAAVTVEIAQLNAKKMKVETWAQHANSAVMYVSLYALLSGFVHASSTSLRDWIGEDSDGNLDGFLTGSTDFGLTSTLCSVAVCIESCLQAIDEVFQLGIHEDILNLRMQHGLADAAEQGDTVA
jgi:hypothetical protein